MFEYNLKIAFINIKIISNLDIKEFVNEPEPYNICINYYISNIENETDIYKIIINNEKNTQVKISYENKLLKIRGDITQMLKENYNKQFSLFGNKGVINRFILHILESEYKSIALHGCAIRHPKTDKVIIGIGPSGSGKSTFISNALKNGWKLISTEQLIIDKKLNLYKGNVYDNISPYALDFIKENLEETSIYENKRLIEPLGEKIFINYARYGIVEEKVKLNVNNASLVILNFKNDDSEQVELKDMDFLLRMLQIASSEKITFPLIFCNEILENSLNGNVEIRNKIIAKIMESDIRKIILSGSYQDFEQYLCKELKN